jgi:5-methylcytosine-specific restriction endonuclease McrA
MDIHSKAKLLGYFAAAGARLSREEKADRNIGPCLLRLGVSVFGIAAATTRELAAQVDAMGKPQRSQCYREFREKNGNSGAWSPPKKPPIASAGGLSRKKLKKIKRAERMQRESQRQQPAPTQAMIDQFYASREWKRLSYDVKLERGRKCECCGAAAPAVRINTDHVKPLRYYWHLRLVKANLQILCEDCNIGKGSRDETDFRERPRLSSIDVAIDPRSALDGPPPDETVIWN